MGQKALGLFPYSCKLKGLGPSEKELRERQGGGNPGLKRDCRKAVGLSKAAAARKVSLAHWWRRPADTPAVGLNRHYGSRCVSKPSEVKVMNSEWSVSKVRKKEPGDKASVAPQQEAWPHFTACWWKARIFEPGVWKPDFAQARGKIPDGFTVVCWSRRCPILWVAKPLTGSPEVASPSGLTRQRSPAVCSSGDCKALVDSDERDGVGMFGRDSLEA